MTPPLSSFFIGAAKVDITPNAIGGVMFGWGDNDHVVHGVATRLYARAVTLEAPTGEKTIFLCLDLGFITEALHRTIVSRLGITDDELILSATHTHSAPGGFSDYVLYSLSCNGFIPEIFETYVAGAVAAVEQARKSQRPGKVKFAAGNFPEDQPVAFNRSIRAYNRNPEVVKRSRKERHLAVDREMTLLRFEDLSGKPIALWNWFPVHATSMHRDRHQIHSDNKGLAAVFVERNFEKEGHPDFVAAFAQGAAGDVSPNFRYYNGLREKRGANRDDTESCRINAELQAAQAEKLFLEARNAYELEPTLSNILEFHDFSNVAVLPEFVEGRKGLRTGPAEFGTPQLYGTAEGRGTNRIMLGFLRAVIRICQLFHYLSDRYYGVPAHWPWSEHPIQGNKVRVISSGISEIFETARIQHLIFPSWVHPTIGILKKWARQVQLKERPFTPQILPIQLCRLGDLLIVAVPAEFTTVAGARLRKSLEANFKSVGVRRAVIQGYANAFSSYVTTPEEYTQQGFEGGCTLFGRWTLPAYLTLFRRLSDKLIHDERPDTLRPPLPSEAFMRTITRHL